MHGNTNVKFVYFSLKTTDFLYLYKATCFVRERLQSGDQYNIVRQGKVQYKCSVKMLSCLLYNVIMFTVQCYYANLVYRFYREILMHKRYLQV